jgi:tRNA 2-thiouridine synthesizing protein B
MATLHLVNKSTMSGAFGRCLSLAGDGDAVFLVEDGVYCGLRATLSRYTLPDVRLFALQSDVVARGIETKIHEPVRIVTHEMFVELVATHQPIVTWSDP